MTFGLVNASFSFPEWQAVKMIFFAPWHTMLIVTGNMNAKVSDQNFDHERVMGNHELDGENRNHIDYFLIGNWYRSAEIY